MFVPDLRKSISTVNELQAKGVLTKNVRTVKLHLRKEAKQGAISACSVDQGNWTKT